MYGLKMDGVWNVWIMYELCCIYLLVPVNQKNTFRPDGPQGKCSPIFFPWIMYELHIDCAWIIYGLRIDYV